MNLTDRDSAFQPVTELQNVNLEISSMDPDAEPWAWDTLCLYLQSDGSRVPSADNLGVPRAAAVLQPNGDIYLQPLDVFGYSFDVILTLYNNPDNPDGRYWRLGSHSTVTATEPEGASVESNLDLYLNPMNVFNRLFEMTLEFYDNPRDPDGLYWHKVVDGHFQLLLNPAVLFNIDVLEDGVLGVSYPVMRDALAKANGSLRAVSCGQRVRSGSDDTKRRGLRNWRC